MKVIAVIPARYNSKRFPGKPLVEIRNKPLIQWVYEKVKMSNCFDIIVIATDDENIYNTVKGFGADVMMTSKKHKSGTDRVAEVAKKIDGESDDIIVNIQGDEPLISPITIKKIVMTMKKNREILVATPICLIKDKNEFCNPNIVKVTVDKNMFALYFSRSPIPHSSANFYKHIGLYAYRRDFLFKFVRLSVSKLENIERLEQLRILENGYRIKTVLVRDDSIPVDVPEDVKRIELILKNKVRI